MKESSTATARDLRRGIERASSWVELNPTIAMLVERYWSSPSKASRPDALVHQAEAACVALIQKSGKVNIESGLPLVPMLDVAGRKKRDAWIGIAQVLSQRSTPGQDLATEFHFNAVLLMVEGALGGCDDGLVRFLDRLIYGRSPPPKDLAGRLGALLRSGHWFDQSLIRVHADIPRIRDTILAYPDPAAWALPLLSLLGFDKKNAAGHLALLFEELALPCLLASLERLQLDDVLELEGLIYVVYAQKIDTAAHFSAVVGRWMEPMARAGRALRPRLSHIEPPANDPVRIGFMLHAAQTLGHTEALFSFLRGLTKMSRSSVQPYLYVLKGADPNLTEWAEDAHVPLIPVSGRRDGPIAIADLMALRQHIVNDRIDTLVYVSNVLTMPLAFAMGIAPVQIWWSMKYHGLRLDEIDGYLALGSFARTKTFEGDPMEWRAVHRAFGSLHDPSLADEARRIRQEVAGPNDIVFGCIGREEKLASADYIGAVAAILRAVPRSEFIWTGRTKLPEVQKLLDSNGISERAHFVGWINTKLYAQVIDIFADSFPFASGLTAFEAMAAGRPVVGMKTIEAMETGWPTHILPIFEGLDREQAEVRKLFDGGAMGSLLPIVDSVPAYVATAVRLAEDLPYRTACATALKTFVDCYMTNETLMAESGCAHLLEIIAAKQRSDAAPRGD